MPGIGFGKRPNPRKFDYIPRYFDPAKEDLERRIGQYKKGANEEEVKDRIKYGLRQRYNSEPGYRSSEVKRSNMRLLYIIGILILVSYMLIQSDIFTRFLSSFN